jgi:hypothetical protein
MRNPRVRPTQGITITPSRFLRYIKVPARVLMPPLGFGVGTPAATGDTWVPFDGPLHISETRNSISYLMRPFPWIGAARRGNVSEETPRRSAAGAYLETASLDKVGAYSRMRTKFLQFPTRMGVSFCIGGKWRALLSPCRKAAKIKWCERPRGAKVGYRGRGYVAACELSQS